MSAVLTLLSHATAHAAGVAGGVGVVVVDNLENRIHDDDAEFTSESMVGPLVSVALRGGDWVDHQLVAQFQSSRGPYDIHMIETDESAGGSISMTTLGLGYQIGLDFWGKEGLHGLSPCLAVGFVAGSAWIRMLATSDDADVQRDLEDSGLDDQHADTGFVAFHALVGLRVRLEDNLGIRAVVARSTTGGLSWWQPQVVMDFTPHRAD